MTKLTKKKMRRAMRKGNTMRFLKSLPKTHLFAPEHACGCMYHDLLRAEFDVEYVRMTYDEAEVDEMVVNIEGSFAERFERAASAYIGQHANNQRPRRDGWPTITRDEAISIAKGVPA